jgi:LysR family hydrogen peroxide-inducible transcriptional activator
LKRKYPKLGLQLVESLTHHLLDDLKAGRLDAVLAARTFDEQGLQVTPVFFEPFVVMAPRAHPFARRSSVPRSLLDAKDMILLEDGHCLADQTVELCPPKQRGVGSPGVSDFHATSLETLKQLVALEAGYTLIPLLAAREDPAYRDSVRFVPLAEESAGRAIALVSRADSGRGADLTALAETVAAAVSGQARLGRKIKRLLKQ